MTPAIRAGIAAWALSGAPSTVWSLVSRRPVLEPARAAGVLLGKPSVVRGIVAHTLISAWWTAVLTRALPRRHRVPWGIAAGAAIHVFDMELIGRRLPRLRDLPRLPQLADHLAFALLVALLSSHAGNEP